MSAPGSGKPTLTDSRHDLPGAAAEHPRPAAPPRGRDRLAADPRPGRVRVPPLDRPDPRLAADLRRARDGDRVPAPARDPLARERAPDRKRGRLHPPRARHGARRLVEHERLVDLRRHSRRLAALEAPDPVPRGPRLQPLELRARPLLPAARPRARRPARVLVGADVVLARPRAGDHHRRRLRDPAAAAAAAHRRHLLGHLHGEHRRDRGQRPRHDGELARRPGLGLVLLARSRLLARDPRLPLLHDHRPEDDPRGRTGRRVYAVSIGLLAALLLAPQTTEFGSKVAVLSSLAIVCAARPLLVLLADAARRRGWEAAIRRAQGRPRGRCRGSRRRRRLRRSADRRREPSPLERRGDGSPRIGDGRAHRRHRQAGAGDRADRRAIRPADRAGPGRRSRERVGGAPGPRPHARDGWRGRRPPGGAVAADRGAGQARPTSLATRSSASASPSSPATARLRRPSSRARRER